MTMEMPARRSEPNSRSQKLLQQFINERNPAEREDREQGNLSRCGCRAKAESQNQVEHDPGDGEKSDQRCPASCDFYRLFPKATMRRLMSQLWLGRPVRAIGSLRH